MKLLGQRLMARDFDRQVAEIQVRIAVLNHCPAMHVHMHERGLYRARHTHHRDHGLSLSGERGAPTISRFAQQSRFEGELCGTFFRLYAYRYWKAHSYNTFNFM